MPTLAERLHESLKVLVDWIKSKGGVLKEITAEKPNCYGAVVLLDDLHCVQRVGKDTYSIHRLDRLDKAPVLNDPSTEIKYAGGVGKVSGRDHKLGLGE